MGGLNLGAVLAGISQGRKQKQLMDWKKQEFDAQKVKTNAEIKKMDFVTKLMEIRKQEIDAQNNLNQQGQAQGQEQQGMPVPGQTPGTQFGQSFYDGSVMPDTMYGQPISPQQMPYDAANPTPSSQLGPGQPQQGMPMQQQGVAAEMAKSYFDDPVLLSLMGLGDVGTAIGSQQGRQETRRSNIANELSNKQRNTETNRAAVAREQQAKSTFTFNKDKFGAEHQLALDKFSYLRKKDNIEADEKQAKNDRKGAEGKRESNIIIQDLNRALGLIIDNPKMTTGLVGKGFKYNPHSDAGKVFGHLASANDLISLDKLRRMRENSASGASGMGQLSVQEGERLKKAFGNLDQGQDGKIVTQNIKRAINLLMDTIHGTPDHIMKVYEDGGIDKEMADALSFRWEMPYDDYGKKDSRGKDEIIFEGWEE